MVNIIKTAVFNIFRATLLTKIGAAYLEPGSTSFLLKIIISGLVGIVIFFRQIWSYIRLLWDKIRGKKKEVSVTAVANTLPPKEQQ
ncbi:hypothetical protein [Candidatus Leptofilum sp.]|uniref:hypothetical protein n=1 Tax=Candidatus Leptofilum sp. TaxID=3241576 RepID=UPI003B5CF00E